MKQRLQILTFFGILSSLSTILSVQPELQCGEKIPDSFWLNSFEKLKSRLNQHSEQNFNKKKAKNVIIFVGDGLGISTMTAGRIYQGQQNIKKMEKMKKSEKSQNLVNSTESIPFDQKITCGAEYEFFFEKNLPMTGLSKTYSINKQTPDSASTATAMFSGKKTEHFNLGHPEDVDQKPSILEYAKKVLNKKTGFVTTTHIFHATPAALYAHHLLRWEYKEVLSQFLNKTDCFDVALGGGSALAPPEAFSNITWTNVTVENVKTPMTLDSNADLPLIGMFSPEEMPYSDERDPKIHPNLTEMTLFTLEKLVNENGFFMMSEGGRIDQAHHKNYAKRALVELVELDEAIEATFKRLEELNILDETLIVLTADHSHQFVMGSYSDMGDTLFGFLPETIVNTDQKTSEYSRPKGYDGSDVHTSSDTGDWYMPLSYVTGPGGKWQDLNETRNETLNKFEAIDFQFPSFVRTRSATHAGEDVAIFARGPQSHLVSGSHEQSDIYYVMKEAFEFVEPGVVENVEIVSRIQKLGDKKLGDQKLGNQCSENECEGKIEKNWWYGVQVVYVLVIVLLSVIYLRQKNSIKELETALYNPGKPLENKQAFAVV